MFPLKHYITSEVPMTADGCETGEWERQKQSRRERQGWVWMSLGCQDKWGHRRGLISSSLVFTPWRKRRRRRWRRGCISTLVVNETSPRSFVLKWRKGGGGGGGMEVCLSVWLRSGCMRRCSIVFKKSVWKKSESNCGRARWQMRKRNREVWGICH